MKQSILHFIILIFILTAGVAMFIFEQGDKPMQMTIGIITAFSYTAWGIIHHMAQKDLHRKIVVEYTLIGVIAIVLLLTIFG
jgi:EamA domain-containing membrane protein RarD